MVAVRVSAFIRCGEPPQVLLIQHHHQGHIYVTLPGGVVDEGETMEHALMRGVRDEIGLDVALNDLLFVADMVDPITGTPRLDLIFSGTIVSGDFGSALQGSPPSEEGERGQGLSCAAS